MSSIRRYEHKLATQRVCDQGREALTAYLATDKMLHENFRSDHRTEAQRFKKEQRAAQQEQYVTAQLRAADEAKARETMLREQDMRLAEAVARAKAEATREAKNVARVCEQSEELRELESKLKAAYVNKEREVQVVEAASMAMEQDASAQRVAEAMEEERLRGLQAEAYREHLRRQDGEAMRRVLDDQMEEKQDRKAQAYQEFLKEKDMVDKVVAAILEEDAREKAARHAKEDETRSFIDDFIRDKEEHKERRMQEIDAENALIKEYAGQVMAREQGLREEREKSQDAKDAILEQLSAEMAQRNAEAAELEQLRNDLETEEMEERILLKEKEKLARAVQQRMDMALANEYQRQLKAVQREAMKKEDDHFRAKMLEKFAEDDRIDQLNSQRRRQKQIEHRHAIERLLEERRAAFETQRAMELQEQVDDERISALRSQIIEEERKRLLAQHAKNLGLRHLPKGVLSSEGDAALFGGAD